jgi:hypothetical protein
LSRVRALKSYTGGRKNDDFYQNRNSTASLGFYYIMALDLIYLPIKESYMKDAINEVKVEVKAKLLLWNNIQSRKLKVALVFLSIALIGLKVFTTVLTFDWLASLFN